LWIYSFIVQPPLKIFLDPSLLRAMLFLCRCTRECVMAERTPAPKAKTSPLNPHRRLPVVLLGAAVVRCRRCAPCLSFLGAGLRAEQLFFLQELMHAVATGPSAPQRRPELRPAPVPRTPGRCRAPPHAAPRAMVTLCARVRTEEPHPCLSLTRADPDLFL
jgi:hypothetical protein